MMKWPTNIGYAIGALERQFYEVALELAEGDASCIHFTYPDVSGGAPATLPAGFSQYHQIDITHPTSDTLAEVTRLATQLRITFAMLFDIQPVHPLNEALRRAGVQTIVPYWGAPISGISPAWKLALKRMLLSLSRTRADGLIFESQAMADLAIKGRGVPESMVDVVPLGVDISRFAPAPESRYVHTELGVPPQRRTFVFTGHCTPRKGIRTLIDAAIELLHHRKRHDACILLCGNRADESEPYEALYRDLEIAPHIRFLGYRRDVLQIFQSAFCGVIPSSGWDSFTLSAAEMAATGLPIIASRLQGLAEAVQDRKTGLLFEPGNHRALADCMERMLDHPELAAQYGRAGRARAEQELTLEAQKRGMLRAIRRHLPA